MYNIGLIGRGFVGSAVAHGFSEAVGYKCEMRIYDKDPTKKLNSLEEVVRLSDIVFISVPTPSASDGSISLDVLASCIEEINQVALSEDSFDAIYLIRSTVVPGTTRNFQEKYPKLKFVFNPEFLTERTATFDFISQTRYVLGGKSKNVSKVSGLYKDRFGKSVSTLETDFESAELIKYACNTFFATKVSFLNEMRLVSDKVGAKWDDVLEGFIRDGRVGHSHTKVPGPDGKFGFGGSCFPKDIQAMINFGEKLGIDLSVLKGAWKTNLSVRPEKDWELLKGRSLVNEDN